MLEKPDLPETSIVACLQEAYLLHIAKIAFLPIGADLNTAVYRAVTPEGNAYFVKLRRHTAGNNGFAEVSVRLPKFLYDQGLAQVIAPLPTAAGQLWAEMEAYRLILYPFVEGRDGYQVALNAGQWADFGRALKHLHTAPFPPEMVNCIPTESYSPQWRAIVQQALRRIETERFSDPAAADLAAFLEARRGEVVALVEQAAGLARMLQAHPPASVVCHSDVHAGNILVDPLGKLYIVDWDAPIRAPRERDLMFIGGAQGFQGCTPREEEAFFYRGYGPTPLDITALAYYRFERIIEDMAIYCEQLLSSNEGGDDRAQALRYLKSNFLPGGTIEAAYRALEAGR